MEPPTITTDRLLLRPWRESDIAPMAAINSDPEVTEFLNVSTDPKAVDAFYGRATGHWDRYGYGWFATESREPGREGTFLGFVGVWYPDYLPALEGRVELGWRLGRAAWGRGLATEGARAALDFAFTTLDLDEVIAVIHPDNVRSRRVAEKLGMTIEGPLFNPVLGREIDVWKVERS